MVSAAEATARPESPPSYGRRLRIWHVVSSLNVGGLEQFVVRLAEAQRLAGHDACIIALHDGPLRVQAEKRSVSVHVVAGPGKLLRVARYASLCLSRRPEIVHAHNTTCIHYAALARRLTAARTALTCHGLGLAKVRPASPEEWSAIDAVVAVSDDTARQVENAHNRDRLIVLRNGVDPEQPVRSREAVRGELGLDDRPVAIIVARIDGHKGHENLLRALALLKRSPACPMLLIVGDGSEKRRMELLAVQLGLDPERARFLGYRSDIADLLAACDLFVLPSDSEGLPLSVLEAMAHGLPVVATRVGGIPELVGDGRTGLLVPPGDVSALAAALARLTVFPDLRLQLGEAGAARVRDEFSFDGMTAQYEAIYAKLLDVKPR
jgi:glycosyltransferase involved in cell wall biosynthesis